MATDHPLPPSVVARPPLTQPLVLVTGKGGVGKSTVAAALGLAAVRDGRRTIVVEVAGRHDTAALLAGPAAASTAVGRVTSPVPGLDHLSLDPGHALHEYLHRELPGPLARLLLTGGFFALLADATPGLAELVTIGKVWQLTRGDRHHPPYDTVILDAPATGHALGLLTAPGTFAAAARTGPVTTQSHRIDLFLRDARRTAVVAVAAPEELAVAETLHLRDALHDALGLGLAEVIVDALLPERFSPAERALLAAQPPSRWRRAALAQAARAAHQQRQLHALRHGFGATPVTTLPFLFTPALGPAELARLAARL